MPEAQREVEKLLLSRIKEQAESNNVERLAAIVDVYNRFAQAVAILRQS